MNFNEAKEILNESGYTIMKETLENEIDWDMVLDSLDGWKGIISNKENRKIFENFLKTLLNNTNVKVFNAEYREGTINRWTNVPSGYRLEKGTFADVEGKLYLIDPIALKWDIKDGKRTWTEFVRGGSSITKFNPKKLVL